MSSIIRATTTSGLQIAPDNSGSLQLQTNGTTTALTIDTSQNVLVGTTSGFNTAANRGNISVNGTTDSVFSFGNGGSSSGYIYSYSTGLEITTVGSRNLVFQTNNTERMRIDSSGNVLIGTTSVDAAGSKIQLSSSGNRVFTIENTANVNGDQALFVKLGSNCNTTASPAIICRTGATDRLIVWGNGNVVNTNNSYGSISDIKLKENIVDATPKLDKLNQVRVVNYNLIGEEQKQLGVIAQELEQIFPSMIDESPDLDKEGNEIGTTTKSIKYSVFVPMLIKCIQEQQTIINDLKARIETLEAK